MNRKPPNGQTTQGASKPDEQVGKDHNKGSNAHQDETNLSRPSGLRLGLLDARKTNQKQYISNDSKQNCEKGKGPVEQVIPGKSEEKDQGA